MNNQFRIFVSRLNKLSIPYMITGAVASIIYGEPRLTNDIDLVINMGTSDVDFVIEAGSTLIPVEVKYKQLKQDKVPVSLRSFIDKYNPERFPLKVKNLDSR